METFNSGLSLESVSLSRSRRERGKNGGNRGKKGKNLEWGGKWEKKGWIGNVNEGGKRKWDRNEK